MVLGLVVALGALDPEPTQVLAQACEWALVEKAREIVGAVRQELAAADADEEVEELALGALDRGGGRGLGERRMGHAERARVAAQVAEPRQQYRVGCARQQGREQRVFLRARRIDVVDRYGFAIEVRPQNVPRNAGDGLDRNDALGWNSRPVGDGRLGNADLLR